MFRPGAYRTFRLFEQKDRDGCFWFVFYCPGCEDAHSYILGRPSRDGGPCWTWDANYEAPTINPSLLVNAGQRNPVSPVCHLFLERGKLRFLGDCSHKLDGQTVDLPALPEYLA